jgi:hypothetical protein
MLENITKIREIIKTKIVKYEGESPQEYNKRIDDFLISNVSSKFKTMKTAIQNVLELYLNSITDKKYIIMFLLTIKNANTKVTELNDDPTYKENILFNNEELFRKYIENIQYEKTSMVAKVKKSLTTIKNFFTQSTRLRILNRESSITTQMFSLLMSDVLIYTLKNIDIYIDINKSEDKTDSTQNTMLRITMPQHTMPQHTMPQHTMSQKYNTTIPQNTTKTYNV